MKSFKILSIIAVAAMLGTVFAGCSSHRKTAAETPAVQTTEKRVKGKRITEVANLASTYTQWETFYAPFSLKAVKPMSMSVSGRATMVRDQYIHLSLRMFGFEVAVVYVDADSAFMADKYHKVYVAEPLSALTARTGLTVGDLQDLMLGRAFYPGQGTLCSIEGADMLFSPSTTDGLTTLMPRRLPAGASWFFTIDSTPNLRSLTVEPDRLSPFKVNFEDVYSTTEAGAVASYIEVSGNLDGRPIEASCQWNVKKAKWNESVKISKPGFKGYQRLTVAELLKVMKQM